MPGNSFLIDNIFIWLQTINSLSPELIQTERWENLKYGRQRYKDPNAGRSNIGGS